MQNKAIFSGVKVIELASVLAGPSVGQFFAELGAEVIKIENAEIGGDVTRSWKLSSEPENSQFSAYFSAVNVGKKSVTLNLKSSEEVQKLYGLIPSADIVIASYKPGDADKLGVSYEDFKKLKADIIYGHITGFGLEDDRVGYDAIVQAESGFVYLNGPKDGLPQKMPVALTDVLAGHHLKEGLLVAWIKKLTTGQGSYVHVSLLEAAVSSLVNQATNWMVAGKVPQRLGSEHPNIVPYGNIFQTKDRQWLMIAVGSDKQFAELCAVLSLSGLADDPRFCDNAARVKNREALRPVLVQAFELFDLGVLSEAFLKRDVPFGRVNSMDQVFESPAAREMVLETLREGVTEFGLSQVAFALDGHLRQSNLLPPPGLGEHTEEVFG